MLRANGRKLGALLHPKQVFFPAAGSVSSWARLAISICIQSQFLTGNTLTVTSVVLDCKTLWQMPPACQLKQPPSCGWVRKRGKGSAWRAMCEIHCCSGSWQQGFSTLFLSVWPAYFYYFKASLLPPQLWCLFSGIKKLPSSSLALCVRWGAAQGLSWGGSPQVNMDWASLAHFR